MTCVGGLSVSLVAKASAQAEVPSPCGILV